MADFEIAVAKTIENEGGDKCTETEGDRGGATKYGISLKFLRNLHNRGGVTGIPISSNLAAIIHPIPTKETIKSITIEDAQGLYEKFFWDANRYGEIDDQDIANKVFDMAVLMGAYSINIVVQKYFNKKLNEFNQLKEDGIFGEKTLDQINCIYISDFLSNEDLIEHIELYCSKHFLSMCNKDKSQSKFLLGWLNRVLS